MIYALLLIGVVLALLFIGGGLLLLWGSLNDPGP